MINLTPARMGQSIWVNVFDQVKYAVTLHIWGHGGLNEFDKSQRKAFKGFG